MPAYSLICIEPQFYKVYPHNSKGANSAPILHPVARLRLRFCSSHCTISLSDLVDSAGILVSTHLDCKGPVNLRDSRLRPDEGGLIELT